jgi:hypothetical protein
MELAQTTGTDLAIAWSSVFAAVGTVGAFIVGGWVLFRQVKRDRESDAERERSRRRRQAELVAAWVGSFDVDSDKLYSETLPQSKSRTKPDRPTSGTTPAAIVRNSSRLPVWDVSLNWVTREGPILNNTMSFATIPPGDEVAWEAPDWLPKPELPNIGIQISFRDAGMVWWRRDQYGILTDLGSPSPPGRTRE